MTITLWVIVEARGSVFPLNERKQENTHTGADSSSVNNIPLLSDYQQCNIICYWKEHNGQKYVLKKLT